MTTPDDNFSTHFETLALDDRTLGLGHAETIVPDSFRAGPEALDALSTLPRIGTGTEPGETIDLEVRGMLGEGGMGLVRLARQVSLDRDVAVKTLRAHSEGSAPKLLQEAYVTGRLEHPNIIPVYTLGRDDAGAPLIVMKRIDGVCWLDVLRDEKQAPGDAKVDLLWHLDILLQICNALRYAHRHDVIHRDIKPENVMIGLFGEVYLLDWGIAVSIAEDRGASTLPHREDVVGMSGTPAYMAPEMTSERALEQDERTDIYLLGAVLHEVLTGRPRHAGEKLFDVLRSAFENNPVVYPASVPAELGAIANRAMATEKADRYQSVEAFRVALLDFIEHRGALVLIVEAEALLERIAEMLASPDLDEDEVEFAVHDLFIECRFACAQAMRAWPESEAATAIYHRYLSRRFDYAIARRDAISARGLLTQMEEEGLDTESSAADLKSLIEARSSEAEELRGLRELAADLDLGRGRVSRSLAVLLMGGFWALDTFRSWYMRLGDTNPDQAGGYVAGLWRVVLIGAVFIFLFRKPLFSTAGNRRLAYILMLTIAAIAVFRAVYFLSPGNIDAFRAAEIGMFGVAAFSAGMLADDLRISFLGALYFPAAILAAVIGPDAGVVLAAVHLIVFAGASYFWTPKQMEKRLTL